MVNAIDIHKLTFEELTGVVSLYPWYGAARMELCQRLSAMDALSDSQIADTALRIGSRKLLSNLVNNKDQVDCTDANAQKLVEAFLPSEDGTKRQVFVVGGDYFTQNQYDNVRSADDNVFAKIAKGSGSTNYQEPEARGAEDFCTEALAKIYLEQEYPDEAIAIYSKLSLLYPEKSVYFAALIEKINKNR